MFTARTNIGQSRPRRKRNKTLGMCVKGDAGFTGMGGGLLSFTLPMDDSGLTNATTQTIDGFASSSSIKPDDIHRLLNKLGYEIGNASQRNIS